MQSEVIQFQFNKVANTGILNPLKAEWGKTLSAKRFRNLFAGKSLRNSYSMG